MSRQFHHDGITFHYRDIGQGLPFVFQHGLSGDVSQPCGLFTPPAGIRLISFDCRAHGETQPLGPVNKLCFSGFADDLAALLSHLKIDRVVIGGISMGAALAVRFALQFPRRVMGLVPSRPAWLAGPNYENAKLFTDIADLICDLGPARGREQFCRSQVYTTMMAESPDCAGSLAGQFDGQSPVERAVRLRHIPQDAPYDQLSELTRICVPTLVMANRQDPIHLFHYGQTIAEQIDGAEFQELTPKSVSSEQHAADVQLHLGNFLERHYL
ncbi:MAG: alpha/beta hydrolase [Fuerstiella sp.]|nr:alpha/beta hydrolase [Fuerstiella sp.]